MSDEDRISHVAHAVAEGSVFEIVTASRWHRLGQANSEERAACLVTFSAFTTANVTAS